MAHGMRASQRAANDEPVRLTDTAVCPYCGKEIVLGECQIVATSTVTENSANQSSPAVFQDLGGEEDNHDDEERDRPHPISGAKVFLWRGTNNQWPVVHLAPLTLFNQEDRGRWSRFTSGTPELPNVDELGAIEDIPARLCPYCATPLPYDIDDREILTIAVVGVTGATKTHYLASMLRTAYHDQALYESINCSEFAPDEDTSKTFHNNYYLELFVNGAVIPTTQVEFSERVRFLPLAFRVTFRDGVRRTLLFHDVPGEFFTDKFKRNRFVPFIRRADGVIFLIDPRWMPPVSRFLSDRYGIRVGAAPRNQADVIGAVMEEIGRSRDLTTVPIAVVVSKSDLVSGALGGTFMFDKDPPAERNEWMTNMNEVSDEVEYLLTNELRTPDLLAAIRRIPSATFHAVSPLGFQPTDDEINVDDLRPRRCLDPLVSLLNRITDQAV